MPIHQPIPSKTLNLQNLGETNTPPPHVPRVITPPIPSNATKIGNPTSQCALLGLKLVQLSTLAGRIFFCHSGQISDGVCTELIRSLYAPSLRIYSVYTLSPLHRNFSTCDKKKILPASVLNWTNFKPIRAHWLVGFPILMAFGCTFIHGGVHTRMHVYWGRGIHYRGCTFIAGGVHTRTHVYWGRGINYRRCTFIAGGVHTRTHILPQLVKSI